MGMDNYPSRLNNRNDGVPEEYRHDPDYYWALQASLQDNQGTGQGINDDLYNVQN